MLFRQVWSTGYEEFLGRRVLLVMRIPKRLVDDLRLAMVTMMTVMACSVMARTMMASAVMTGAVMARNLIA